MAVRIRLKRLGAKRLHFIELLLQIPEHQEMVSLSAEIGYFDPTKEPNVLKVDAEQSKKKWLSTGAQPSDTAKALLKKLA